MANPVVHFEILGKEHKKLQAFYSDLFGWKVDASNPEEYGLVEAAEGGIGGGIGPTNLLAGHLTFYISVPDIEAALKDVVSKGGRVMSQPVESMGVKHALFADPEGNVVGLVQI